MRDQRWKTSKQRSLQKLEISTNETNDGIRRFSMIMEYYTKSEGLGFLIGKSRIDFRIEFRGVSILCEFNSLIWSVSHDHHQTDLLGRKPASVPLIQRFQIQMVTNDHMKELQRIRHYPAGVTQTIRL